MKKRIRLFSLLLLLSLIAALLNSCGDSKDKEMPGVLLEVAERAAAFAEQYAKQLDGQWGDMHALLMASGEGKDFPGFEDMQAVLRGFVVESGISDIYALYPPGPKVIVPYIITVDGSVDVAEYGTGYEWEEALTTAWGGEAAPSEYARIGPLGDIILSAYAPVRDSGGKVAAILGVDYPAPEFADFPDWIDEEAVK